VSWPDTAQTGPYRRDPHPEPPYPPYPGVENLYPRDPYDRGYPDEDSGSERATRKFPDAWMDQRSTHFPRLRRRSIALFLLRLPAFVPWIFIIRGWLSLNAKEVLTNTEADVLGTGGEICFFVAVSITPLITITGARWFAPLRRWYGIFFALIGISDAATAAITTDFSGGVFGRLAGHTFLVTGFFVVLMAVPLLVTANTPAQRRLGRYWKRLQRATYILWGLIVLHLLLLDDFIPFGGPQGDGDPVFHQRVYQAVAISLPLVVLRLPPVKRWIATTRAAGQQWKVWLAVAPMAALWILGFAFIINEEIFTGTMAITMRPPDN
jgi:DMSO/TMAO reductase YedYZ heme-binding membrane subunit